MSYYVSHVTPERRARLHDETCSLLRDSKSSRAANAGLSVPFEFIEQAEAYMDLQFSHFADRRRCSCCTARPALARAS